MTTKAAALALRKGEQKGAIAAKKAEHERVGGMFECPVADAGVRGENVWAIVSSDVRRIWK
jgi:hypothetical protein